METYGLLLDQEPMPSPIRITGRHGWDVAYPCLGQPLRPSLFRGMAPCLLPLAQVPPILLYIRMTVSHGTQQTDLPLFLHNPLLPIQLPSLVSILEPISHQAHHRETGSLIIISHLTETTERFGKLLHP